MEYDADATELLETYGVLCRQYTQHMTELFLDFLMKFIIIGTFYSAVLFLL